MSTVEIKKIGRPSQFTQELADEICERHSNGESLVDIGNDPAMPSRATIYRWQDERQEFKTQCARARARCGDYQDHLIAKDIEGCTAENAHAVKVRISGRMWRAAKMAPDRYGDRYMVDTAKTPLSAEDDETFYAKLVEQAAKLGFDAGSAVRRLEDLRSKTIDGDATEEVS